MRVGDAVTDVSAEIIDLASNITRAAELIVDPSEQNVFFAQFEQVFLFLAIAKQKDQAGMVDQINVGEQADLFHTRTSRHLTHTFS